MAYWLYVVLFVLIILTPTLVHEGMFFLVDQRVTGTIMLFVLGTLSLLLYYMKNTQSEKLSHKSSRCQKEALNTSKNLSDSYGYIGQVNRKMEILRNILLELPHSVDMKNNPEDRYASLREALEIFSDCKRYVIGFYDEKAQMVLKEIKTDPEYYPDLERGKLFQDDRTVIDGDHFHFIRTKTHIYHIYAYCVLDKKSVTEQDVDLIKAILAQALFLYIYTKEKIAFEKKSEQIWP